LALLIEAAGVTAAAIASDRMTIKTCWLSTASPPRQPLISRAAEARFMTEPNQICKFRSN